MKIILLIIASLSLTSCVSSQYSYQPMPQHQAEQLQGMPTTFSGQKYIVTDTQTGETKRYSIQPR